MGLIISEQPALSWQ